MSKYNIGPQTGNILFSGNTLYTSNGGNINISGSIVPLLTSFSLGNIANPYKDLWLQPGTVYFANISPGVSALALGNRNNYLLLGAGAAGMQVLNPALSTVYQISSGGITTSYIENVSANTVGGFAIIGSSDRSYQNVTSPGVMMHITGNDNINNRIVFDSFGSNAFTQIIGRSARGSAKTPSATLSGDTLLRITAQGYNSLSGWVQPSGSLFSPTTIEAVAIENFANGVGTQWNFYNAVSGDITADKKLNASINSTGIVLPISGSGVTFGDNSRQITAFNASSGSWTPILTAAVNGTGILYTNGNKGSYFKNGKRVYATFSIILSSLDASSGNIYLTGLPVPAANITGVLGDLRVTRYLNMNTKCNLITGELDGPTQNFTLYYIDNSGGTGTPNMQVSDLNATSQIHGCLDYVSV